MIILGIETSCDETAVAIVQKGRQILANCICSQMDLHKAYGGVVPELASRRHIHCLFPLLQQALTDADLDLQQIDAIAATYTPGLMGALLTGICSAKSLAFALDKPFIGVHHIEAHLYSSWMSNPQRSIEETLPALGLVISGGHTLLCHIPKLGVYNILSHTLDDAIGEAFDKVAVMLGFTYPGGPQIEQLSKQGDCQKYRFKAGMSKKHPWHFSLSGLKTQVLYALWGQDMATLESTKNPLAIPIQVRADIAASFQRAVLEDLISKTEHFIEQTQAKSLWVGGGVSANEALRARFEQLNILTLWPFKALSVDNAAMIAGLGYHQYKQCGPSSLYLTAIPRSPLSSWGLSN